MKLGGAVFAACATLAASWKFGEHYGGIDISDFEIDNASRTCHHDTMAHPFNEQVRGVNIGSWMVLEPWITPSMFYQFLGKDVNETAMDQYSFCKVLGPEEANKQMRRHWDTWVTREDLEFLASRGINSLRLPIGDFQYNPYPPYFGCFDGSLEKIDWLLDTAYELGMNVLLDVHAVRGSQNGFDNGGMTLGFEWTSTLSTEPMNIVTFAHWPLRDAGWMGKFNRHGYYEWVDRANIDRSLRTLELIVQRHKDHPAILGLEPVNEPWQYTPIEELKRYYWEGYLITKAYAPSWRYVMHDSFRFSTDVWGGFMRGCPDIALDTHIYQAWMEPSSKETFYDNACAQKLKIAELERTFGPVIVGEWSLATDNCAMWLNGFNDNLPGYPKLPCKYVECPEPYMGPEQPGAPPDPTKPLQGPYGTGISGPSFGLCPIGRDWIKEEHTDGVNWMRAPADAPDSTDATDEVIGSLAKKKMQSFALVAHGFYFWNFKTEFEPNWSFMEALARGWLTYYNTTSKDEHGGAGWEGIADACALEDGGAFSCLARRDVPRSVVQGGVAYTVGYDADFLADLEAMDDDEFYEAADAALNTYYTEHRLDGGTCDFAGAGMLAFDGTLVDDDSPAAQLGKAAATNGYKANGPAPTSERGHAVGGNKPAPPLGGGGEVCVASSSLWEAAFGAAAVATMLGALAYSRRAAKRRRAAGLSVTLEGAYGGVGGQITKGPRGGWGDADARETRGLLNGAPTTAAWRPQATGL